MWLLFAEFCLDNWSSNFYLRFALHMGEKNLMSLMFDNVSWKASKIDSNEICMCVYYSFTASLIHV